MYVDWLDRPDDLDWTSNRGSPGPRAPFAFVSMVPLRAIHGVDRFKLLPTQAFKLLTT